MGVKVKATRLGYYGLARRRPGEVFVLRDGQKPPKWTVAVPESETGTISTILAPSFLMYFLTLPDLLKLPDQ